MSWSGGINCHIIHFTSGVNFGTHEEHHAAFQVSYDFPSFYSNFLASLQDGVAHQTIADSQALVGLLFSTCVTIMRQSIN